MEIWIVTSKTWRRRWYGRVVWYGAIENLFAWLLAFPPIIHWWMGIMKNEITPPVSWVTQHCFASDKKETSLAFVALKGKITNQKNLMLPFAPTSCASFLSQETPSFDTNNNSALFLRQNTFSSAESKSFGSNSESISKNTASALTMDQIVFHLCLPQQQHPSGLYLLPWYLLKRKTSKKMLRGSSTFSTHVY